MPNKNNYDLDFRPESYWDQKTGFTNIKGEMRRKIIQQAMSDGKFELLPASLFSDELSDEERQLISQIHPAFMGGEFLPGYRDTEVEIARVSLESVMADVISLRAWLEEDGLIHYQIADEYMEDEAGRYIFNPKTSKLPLTMGAIITLMDTAELNEEHSIGYTGLTSWRDHNYNPSYPSKDELESLVTFVQVSSDFYPDLSRWYEDEALEWYTAHLMKLKGAA